MDTAPGPQPRPAETDHRSAGRRMKTLSGSDRPRFM
jgi:hypothetical protein